jgi:hypothetical protein
MEIAADVKYNIGYVKIIPGGKVAYSVAFEKNYVADFDDRDRLVGIELLDAKTYQPGELQSLMSKANLAAIDQRERCESGLMGKRSA